MKKCDAIQLFVFIAGMLFLFGCADEDDYGMRKIDCPLLTDDITWNSYGRFILYNAGVDYTGRRIINSCDWQFHGNHKGGEGDTLQIASSDKNEVIFVWSWNDFYAFNVEEGWLGKTKRGAYIGMDYESFHERHPRFEINTEVESILNDGDRDARAYFDEDGFLTRLYIGRNMRYWTR